jgi:DegV family protein with EDD domain
VANDDEYICAKKEKNMKIGIVTDSTASLNLAEAKEKNIKVVPLSVIINDKTYIDQVEMNVGDVFVHIDAGDKVTSSQPSPQRFVDTYELLKEEGCTDIIVMTCSSALSGTFQSSFIASGMVEGVNIELFDSKTSGFHLEMYVQKAHEMAEAGSSVEDILKELHHIQQISNNRIVIDELDGLVRGGRLSRGAAMLGAMMKVKPVIEVVNGELDVVDRIRTKKKAIAAVIDLIRKDFEEKGKLLVHITHVQSIETSNTLRDKVKQISEDIVIKQCEEITPVLSVHFGRGGFGISWYPLG